MIQLKFSTVPVLMRTAKILGFVVGSVLATIALIMLAVWLFVDPNDYKAKIAAAVKNATGRELMLQGNIKLSVFPWIALELGPASLGNPAGFGDQPFLSFRHAAVRAKLLPLLQRRLEVDRVEIDGLDLRLMKDEAGKGNWEDFGHSSAGTAPKPTEGDSSVGPFPAVRVTGSRISYQKFVLDNVTLEASPSTGGVIPVVMRFDANRGVATEHASVEAKVDFSNPALKQYRLAAFMLTGQANMAGNIRPIRWNLGVSTLDLDLGAQTLTAPNFALTLAGAQVNGSVNGTRIIDAPAVSGDVTLAPLVVREFMPRLGLTGPQTRDPHALSQFAGATHFFYGGNALRLEKVKLTLDDSHVQGDLAIANLTTLATTFDLAADQIDLDRYLPPESAGSSAAATRAPAPTAVKTEAPGASLDVEGTLAVGSVQVSRLMLNNLKVTVLARAGVTHLFPLQAQIYGGRYSGDITLDGREGAPLLSLDEHLTGIDVGKLLTTPGKSVRLSGKGNVNLKAAGRGAGADGILKTLDGHVDAYITDGAVEGVDLGFELARAEALIRRQSLPAGQSTNRTKFDAFKTSAQIDNGVATTKDLTISSQVLRITGQGSANLVSKAIDFQLVADTLRTAQGVPVQLPVKVTGTTSDPTIRPDIEALAKGQLRQKLQDVLGDKLKGLFGKP
jgi:AsmA protein